MHEHYHTKGFIVRRLVVGEKDVLLSILTKEFGLIQARLKSGRLLSSKLRSHAQTTYLVNVSLIKTRNEAWQIVGLESDPFNLKLTSEPLVFDLIFNLTSFVFRMMAREQKEETIFIDLLTIYELLTKRYSNLNIHLIDLRLVEAIFVARSLFTLGYLAQTDLEVSLLQSKLDEQLVLDFKPYERQAISAINQAFAVSGL